MADLTPSYIVLLLPDQLPEPLFGTAAAQAQTQIAAAALAKTQMAAAALAKTQTTAAAPAKTGSWRSVLPPSGQALPTPGQHPMITLKIPHTGDTNSLDRCLQ